MLESEGNTQKCFITSKLWHIILTEGASRQRRVPRCLKRKGYTTFWAVDDHFFQLASTAHPVTMATIEPKKAIFAELEFPQHHVLKFDHPVRGEKSVFWRWFQPKQEQKVSTNQNRLNSDRGWI